MSGIPKEGEDLRRVGPNESEQGILARPAPIDAQEILETFGFGPVSWSDSEGLWTISVEPSQWRSVAGIVIERFGLGLSTLFGEDSPSNGLRVHALFLASRPTSGVHVRCPLPRALPAIPTLSMVLPYVTPFEREIREMFGVEFEGNPDRRPLLLHEMHPSPPMRQGGPSLPSGERVPYEFSIVEGEGIYEIPVGPVHAGVIEPGHFRFQVLGEHILGLETRFGYTHKRTEQLFEGAPYDLGTIWAESISGDMSLAGGMAYTEAVERALGFRPSPGIERARGVLLEAERIAFLCGDVAGIALDVGYAVGAAEANVLREESYQLLGALTGSRLGRAIVGVGGFRRRIAFERELQLLGTFDHLKERIRAVHDSLLDKSSVVDRLAGTGTIPRWVAELMHFVGPVARASGLRIDVRHDRPYGPYRDEEINVPRGLAGDVEARLAVKVDEIVESCRLASRFVQMGVEGERSAPLPNSPLDEERTGLGWVESPRGEFLIHVTIAPNDRLRRVHVRDPSFLNWPAIEFAVRDNIVPDFPLCNKSLNLSYSGYDR